MTYTYTLMLIKGGEVTIEHLIGPSQYDDEIDDACYDVRDARFYLIAPDGEELEIDTTDYDDLPVTEAAVTLNKDQYVRYVCWRTTEWTITSPTPLTADDVKLVPKDFAGDIYVDWDIEVPGVEQEFISAWDGKYSEIVVEASDPEFVIEDED